jgi:hypothetical protein
MAWKSQSIRSARLSVPSSELGPTTPSSASECVSPFGPGGSNTRLRGGSGGTQFRRRNRHSGNLCILYTVKKGLRVSSLQLGCMSLTKLPLGRNNSVMTSLFPPRESLVVTSRLGTGNSRTFFYGVIPSRWWH